MYIVARPLFACSVKIYHSAQCLMKKCWALLRLSWKAKCCRPWQRLRRLHFSWATFADGWAKELSKPAPPQLLFKRPQIPSNRDHQALNRGTLGGLGDCLQGEDQTFVVTMSHFVPRQAWGLGWSCLHFLTSSSALSTSVIHVQTHRREPVQECYPGPRRLCAELSMLKMAHSSPWTAEQSRWSHGMPRD